MVKILQFKNERKKKKTPLNSLFIKAAAGWLFRFK